MLEEQWHNTLTLLRGNTALTVAVVLFIAILCYFKPREVFRMGLFALFIVAVFYVITLLADTLSTGSKQKGEMIYKTRNIVGE
jgi:energy-coupling factor transporter transmembrane protein EcfT